MQDWSSSPCVAFNQQWDVWICGRHPAVEKRTNCFIWSPPGRINSENVQKSLKEYEQFILSSPLKTKLLSSLYGKSFGCWCYRGGPCHGPTLANLAKKAYESQQNQQGLLKREMIPSVFYQCITSAQITQSAQNGSVDLFLLPEPKFIACHIDHQRTGNAIWVHQLTKPMTTHPLKDPLLIPLSEDTYSIPLGPHTIRPLITYQLKQDQNSANLVLLCNELLEKLDKDISFYGLGLSNVTIHSTKELTLNTLTTSNESTDKQLSILLPNEFSDEAIIDDPYVDSENMMVIHALLFTTRDSTEKIIQRVAVLFTQHFIDLQYYDSDSVFDLLTQFY